MATIDQKLLDRINELAKKSRESELTKEEKTEQQELRAKYIATFRGNLKKQLDNIELVRPDGSTEMLKDRKKS